MPRFVLGISAWYHDAAAALVADGRLVAAAAEERFTRKKHDPAFPAQAIQYCLDEAGISIYDVEHIVFYEKPFVKFERILVDHIATFPRSYRSFLRAMPPWLKEKLWIGNAIRRALHLDRTCPILFCEHHLAHAAAAFLVSPFERAAILTLDGVGEWGTATGGVGEGNRLRMDREIRFPHSLGLFYSALTAYLGFEVNDAEWKVMGLAPYGKPRFVEEFRRIVNIADDGSFRLDLDYFAHHWSAERAFTSHWERLFGQPARTPEGPLTEFHQDLARSGQQIVEEAVVGMARDAWRRTGADFLCIAGGVGLNSVANWRVLQSTPFKDIFIQPAAGDDGAAIGAAFWVWNCLLGQPRTFRMEHGCWGPSFADADIQRFLEGKGIPYERLEGDLLVKDAASRLAAGQVVGWFQGRMEFGPRALGSRSILADPRDPKMKDTINAKIKFREGFRPFAPSVHRERAAEFFDLHVDSPFMLLIPGVRDEHRSRLPAITHADGTGRVQTVDRDIQPLYHHLLTAFDELSGVPILVNTSFNVRGEPIVCTPQDAWNCFVGTGLDALYLGSFRLDDKSPGRVEEVWTFPWATGRDRPHPRRHHPPLHRPSSLRKWVEIALAVLLFGEAGSRMGDRLTGYRGSPVGWAEEHPRQEIRPLAGAQWGGRFSINDHGFRGGEFEERRGRDTPRVAVMGGEAAFDLKATDQGSWPVALGEALEQALPTAVVEVINAGVPGQTLGGALARYVEEVRRHRPDILIVAPGMEDLRLARGGPPVLPPPSFSHLMARLSQGWTWEINPGTGPLVPEGESRYLAQLGALVSTVEGDGVPVLVVTLESSAAESDPETRALAGRLDGAASREAWAQGRLVSSLPDGAALVDAAAAALLDVGAGE